MTTTNATRKPTLPKATPTKKTTATTTPHTTTRASIANAIWRTRLSPWKKTTAFAALAAAATPIAELAFTGTITAAPMFTAAVMSPYVAMPIAATFGPRIRARARTDLRNAGTSARLAAMWNRWVTSDEAKPLEYATPLGRRILTGQTRQRPRFVSATKNPLTVTVESPRFITRQQWEKQADVIGRHLHQFPPQFVLDPEKGRATLTFNPPPTEDDALPLIAAWSAKTPNELPDLKALPVARDAEGNPVTLRIWGTHLLVGGATEAGKGSVIWGIVQQLAPGIKTGMVELYGIDPKGGVELGFGRAMFTEFAGDQDDKDTGDEIIRILELTVATMRERLAKVRGTARLHVPRVGAPLIVLIFDEFLTLEAAIPDPKKRRRAYGALTILLSQGRAAAVTVIAAAQLAQKDGGVVKRDLLPTRVGLRGTDRVQGNMTLGDGAYENGARVDMIREDQQGTGFIRRDGQKGSVLCRFPWTSDPAVLVMARDYPTPNLGGQAAPLLPLEPLTPEEEKSVAQIVEAAEQEEKETRSPTQVAIEELLDDDWLDSGEIAAEVASQLGKCSRNYVTKVSAGRPVGAKKLAIHRTKDEKSLTVGKGRDERAKTPPGGMAGPSLDIEKRPTTSVTSIRDCGAPGRDEVPRGDPSHVYKSRQVVSLPDVPFEPETPVTDTHLGWDSGRSLDFSDDFSDVPFRDSTC